mmetsp:Transcript_38452/g.127335  ORF Transcript_38452/g.127335 Transcript_38452/m.127335 type:complete len:234 (+) Transcript_38452:954-1655(+)
MSRFGLASNWRLISITISLAALPTDFIVMAENQYGSIEPTSKPAKVSGSSRSTVTLAPVSFSRVTKAPKRARPTRQAEPMAKPLPVAAVVLPSASSESVMSRTSLPKWDSSARPPALSATGPYASVARVMPRVESMPTAEMATPYAPPSAEVETIATESTSVGGTHEIMPTPRPWMTTVAGPVMPRSLMDMTGPKSKEVKYSVTLPIAMPAARPMMTHAKMLVPRPQIWTTQT